VAEQLGYPVKREAAQSCLRSIENNPELAVCVAESESGKVISWVHVFIARRIFVQYFADLGGLVVDEAARGAQIGAELMLAAEAWAAGRGCQRMIIRSNITRQRAHRFYQHLDYDVIKRQVVFHKRLASAASANLKANYAK
jgi:GNAT superfamily N-acetyltransferase